MYVLLRLRRLLPVPLVWQLLLITVPGLLVGVPLLVVILLRILLLVVIGSGWWCVVVVHIHLALDLRHLWARTVSWFELADDSRSACPTLKPSIEKRSLRDTEGKTPPKEPRR